MRILVGEDNRKVASFVERGLREDGYVVDVAHGHILHQDDRGAAG
jgi:DNA-binding response OmpR family regulator